MGGIISLRRELRYRCNCSWHTYTSSPKDLADNARHVRDLLDGCGVQRTESHLNEWNYGFDWRDEESRRRSFAMLQGPAGASFCAAVLTLLQDSPVDVANYYTGDTQWFGMFDPYGVPRKTFFAFKAFRLLLETPGRVSVRTQGACDGIYCCAGRSEDGRVLQLLLSNASPEAEPCRVQIAAAPAAMADLSVLSRYHTRSLSCATGEALRGFSSVRTGNAWVFRSIDSDRLAMKTVVAAACAVLVEPTAVQHHVCFRQQ